MLSALRTRLSNFFTHSLAFSRKEARRALLQRSDVIAVIGFWIIAALLVIAARLAIAKLAAIFIVSFVYMRFVAREATVDHALFAGAMWLALSIVAELAASTHTGHGWFLLIGSPTSFMRNVLMFAWIFVPSLFARHRKGVRA